MTMTTTLSPPHTSTTHVIPSPFNPSSPGGPERVTDYSPADWSPPPPPGDWPPAHLRAADMLELNAVPASASAMALCDALTDALAANPTGTGTRGGADRDRLRRAVAAIAGGVLTAWGKPSGPRCVFRSTRSNAFRGAPVGYWPFRAAVDGLAALGLIDRKAGIRWRMDWGMDGMGQHGMAARFRPTDALLALVAAHGVIPATIATDFRAVAPAAPPVVAAPVVLRRLGAPPGRPGGAGGRDLPVPPDDPRAAALARQVGDFNAFAARFDVGGCLPPRWHRVFALDWQLGGRWIANGTDAVYQAMSQRRRLGITIDGETVVEVDARASHLGIVHGLLGLPLPEGDPYAVPIPTGHGTANREAVKAWIVATLGNGAPATRWPRGKAKAAKRWGRARDIGAAVLARHPFLAKPWRVAESLAGLGDPRRLLPHHLMGVEARALTDAMTALRGQGMLALPMHDGLIVPASAQGAAREALAAGYLRAAGVRVAVTVATP